MALRSRVYSSEAALGTLGKLSGPVGGDGPPIEVGRHNCDDYVGTGDNGNLDIEHKFNSGGRINLPFSSVGNEWFNNYVATYYQNFSGSGHLSTGAISDGVAAAAGQARSNPSKPYVDIGVAIGELRDIPRLLKIEGDDIIQRAGNANLQYQFGWRPLISDLVRLTQFQSAVEKRKRELRRLHTRGLRRTVTVYTGSVSWTQDLTVQSLYRSVRRNVTRVTQERVRVHTRWHSQLEVPPSSDELLAMARRAVGGLTFDGVTAWNLIPWSFLVDWGFSTGDWLSANRNLVSAWCETPRVMRERITTVSADAYSFNKLTMSAYVGKRITKQRRAASASPLEASLPILTNRQTSILGSIGVTRRFPR